MRCCNLQCQIYIFYLSSTLQITLLNAHQEKRSDLATTYVPQVHFLLKHILEAVTRSIYLLPVSGDQKYKKKTFRKYPQHPMHEGTRYEHPARNGFLNPREGWPSSQGICFGKGIDKVLGKRLEMFT